MSSGGVMLSGWLRKSPPERKLRKNAWKKRWFVLRSGRLSGDPNVLEYFRHQGSKKPIRAISLDECSQIDANVPIKYEKKDPSHQYVFDIVTKTRTYYLVAESPLEMASWVRYLCDLCGFNHDTPENQHDLGTQQQTFKAVQPIRNFGHNGSVPLLEDDASTHRNEVPIPLPRPQNTITKQSVPIQSKPTDANGNIREDANLIAQSSTSASSAGSGHVSQAVTPESQRRLAPIDKDEYSFAVDSSQSSEYVLLAECTDAVINCPDENSKLSERRASTDSVFTHDGATCSGDVSRVKTQRLDSMPVGPPPSPPTKDERHLLMNSDLNRGYAYPPYEGEDDDLVVEARTRSERSGHSLPPIDDEIDLHRVPPSLQKEYRVDELGNPLPGSSRASSSSNASSRFAGLSRNLSAGNSSTTEYINTADASAEAGIGYFTGVQRRDSIQQRNAHQQQQQQQQHQQLFPVPGRPFVSPSNRMGSPQFSPPTFFNPNDGTYSVPRAQLYDVPVQHPVGGGSSLYSTPTHAYPYNSKHSLYSSTSTLTPPTVRSAKQRMHHPGDGLPRIRRSSSVGQLETVANELAAQSSANVKPTHMRRRSIDHRRQPIVGQIPTGGLNDLNGVGRYLSSEQFVRVGADPLCPSSTSPPPRPPKSEATVKQFMEGDYYARPAYASSGRDRPVSPVHTAVIATTIPESPPHTTVTSFVDGTPSHRPFHRTATPSVQVDPSSVELEVPGTKTKLESPPPTSPAVNSNQAKEGLRAVSNGSVGQAEATSGRSDNALYDVPDPRSLPVRSGSDLPEANDPADLYDVPKPKTAAEGSRRLAEIEDANHPSYEPMMSQTEMLERIDDTSHYTSMAGASTLINHSPFSTMTRSPGPFVRYTGSAEPPPVKRDLKPGRRSLGSDGGSSESRSHPSRGSCEDAFGEYSNSSSYSHTPDGPVSPPHVTLLHSIPPSPQNITRSHPDAQAVRSHLHPPERPPKHPSQSSLSPRTPPSSAIASQAPPRSYGVTLTMDRSQKAALESSGQNSPCLPHHATRHISGHGSGPGRPPKPPAMSMHQVPGRDDVFPSRSGPAAPVIPPKSAVAFPSGFSDHPYPASSVPPAPSVHQPAELNYVQLTTSTFPSKTADLSKSEAISSTVERPPKPDEGVQYIEIDSGKTTAMEKTKKAREEELSHHKRPFDTKSAKTFK